jgi:hypothetical protein
VQRGMNTRSLCGLPAALELHHHRT